MAKIDATEKDILNNIKNHPAKLVLTPTGGQGCLLGRGNQQISSDVIQKVGKENIIIVSANNKLVQLSGTPLFVYTGDNDIDKYFQRYYRVKIGYKDEVMYKVTGEEQAYNFIV